MSRNKLSPNLAHEAPLRASFLLLVNGYSCRKRKQTSAEYQVEAAINVTLRLMSVRVDNP